MTEKTVCKLFYNMEDERELLIEEDNERFYVAREITAEQALNIAKVFTRKYDEVRVYDDDYQAYVSVRSRTEVPVIWAYYPVDTVDVAIKYGLYTKEDQERDEMDHTDLDAEKWANYWGDYNQCGVKIDY